MNRGSIAAFGLVYFAGWGALAWGAYRMGVAQKMRQARLGDALKKFREPLHLSDQYGQMSADVLNEIRDRGRKIIYSLVNYGLAEAAIKKNDYVVFGSLAVLLILAWPVFHFFGLLGFPPLVVAWVLLIRMFYTYVGRRYNAKLYEQLPDTIGIIVRSLKVGVPLQRALLLVRDEATYPTSLEFSRVMQDVSVGIPLAQAFQNLAGRVTLSEYIFLATVVDVQAQTGGMLADIMANLESTLRRRAAMKKQAIAASSEARLSSYVLLSIPWAVVAFMEIQNPRYFNILFTSTEGHYLLAGIIGLWLLGLGSIKYITNKVVN
ncbi:type II secretion system F family protein [Gluconacetobacter takamatsuzukensis]|uniref:Secretion system protein n=1 Tax=Gluconacetobacter takamatsuzukensis TaxID=1286190 RepID=A0A7W4KD70_9PROT|nr:type II secretion system F family protein [Gluconacetobacter takamatsuzukensis]MBB2204799.1 secretion system protein [Gluconacetobacter takamatsuzukensis]